MNMKKVLSVFLALVIMLGVIPDMSFAESAEGEPAAETEAETVTITNDANSGTMTVTFNMPERDPVPYIDADGTEKQTGPDCYDVYQTDTSLGINGMERWYKVRESMTLDTEDSLKILGDLRLILCDGATLTVPHGINLDGGSITIYAQSNDPQTMGKLIANAHDNNCAAIGSSGANNPGSVTIIGGDVTATGSTSGAAIGGGAGKTNVNVNIKGGVVHANGTGSGVAIRGNITISGGTVTAKGGVNGAAIMGGTITVNGGDITATSGDNSHAIGGYIIVGGGDITATGGANAAAIGGALIVNDGTINVTGGTNSAAIGCDLTFNGGSVTATGVPALAGSATLIRNTFAKAGDSEAAAVDTGIDELNDKKYVHIYFIPEYTITWKNYNGDVVDTTTALKGSIPTTEVIPEKPSDHQYDYIFDGWTPKVSAVTGDTTYTATYSQTFHKYTITFQNEDGADLQRSDVAYGTTPEYNGATPFKPSDDNNIYSFKGWTPDVVAVTGEATYTATFNSSTKPVLNRYKITATFTNGSSTATKTVSSSTALPYTTSSAALRTLANCQDKTGGKITVVTAGDNIGSISNTSSFIINKTGSEKIRIYNAKNSGYIDCTLTVTLISVLNSGQYIRMGTYKGVPIDWYCVKNNATGCFMICKYALKANKFGADATYNTSDVHAWLDIDSGGTFAKDIGLTPEELSIVRTVNLSSTGGDGTDSFIIAAYGNDELQSGQKIQAPYAIGTSTLVDQYWLRTARDTSNARIVNHSKDGMPIATVSARYSGVGNNRWIRPMFYLATDAFTANSFSGTGTEADPFIFEPKYILKGTAASNGTYTIKANLDGTEIYSGGYPAGIAANASVEVVTTPAATYQVKAITVTGDDGSTIAVNGNKFTMPQKNVNVKVEFERQTFNVVWKNSDGTVLENDPRVVYDTTPTYDGATPTKNGTEAYSYSFKGWTPAVTAATGNATYTAEYRTIPNPAHFSQDGNTYTIHSNKGWEAFCECLHDTDTYDGFNGKTIVLDANIDVFITAATSGYLFKGTFDGKGHAITEHIRGNVGVALFGNISGATIKNLVVKGYVDGSLYCAALVSSTANGSTNTIENVAVEASVTTDDYSTCGGILCNGGENTKNTLRGCVFTGRIYGESTSTVGALYGSGDSSTPIIENCLEAGYHNSVKQYNPVGMIEDTWGTVKNTYYKNDRTGISYRSTTRGLKIHTITTGENVALNLGEGVEYNVSGITAYSTGIEYKGTFYAGKGDKIALTNTPPKGYGFKEYDINAGTVEGNILTMPDEDVTLNAVFQEGIYTVFWKNGDEILETDTNVDEGTVPTYDGETPVKAADAQYTYTFSGWSPEISPATSDITYNAVFNKTIREYTVTWKNGDDVIATDTVAYGEIPVFSGETPVKAADAFIYTFSGWTPEVTEVTDDVTYTAEYTATINPAHLSQDGDTYTIHDSIGWDLFCECLLDNATYNGFSGKTVVLGADITANRNAGSDTAQFKGTFDGQGHKITANISASSRAALFSTINGATIKNLVVEGSVSGAIHCAGLVSFTADGSTNTIENVAVNAAVTTTGSHCGGILGHGGSNTHNTLRGCVFTGSITGGTHVGVLYGWGGSSTPTIENCLEAGTEYTGTNVNPVGLISTWGTVKNTYYNNAIKGSPSQSTTRGMKVHTITTGENVNVVLGESTVYDVSGITAYAAGISYNGTFYAGEGDKITLSNTAPEGCVFKQYTVNAGTVEENTLTMPAEDVTVNVEFTKTYTVTWKNGEEVLETDENVPENTVPTYDGETPVKADEDGITYIFAGWTPEVTAATGDVTYTATFTGLTKVEAKEPAYTSAGNIEYFTGSDGKYYVKNGNEFIETTLEAVTIAQLVLVHHDAVAATCTQTGNIEYWQAEENDKYFSDANGEQEITLEATVVNALGHTFGEWVVTIEAQVGVKGEETHTCSVCGESETRITAALPYVPVTNGDGDKVYSETVTEETKDVTELFAQAKAGDGTVEVHSDDYAIVFDSDAVSAIGDANVTLSVKVITEDLPENVPENAELVLEVTLLGATFEVGQAKVSIPLEGEVPEGKVARVYYVDDLGNKTDMNAVFENGIVTFTTNHFSTYVLVFEDEASSGTLHFSAVSLTLQNNLKENFYVRKDMLVSGGFTDPYVVFSMNGRAVTVNEYSEVNSDDVDYYVFSFANIAPNQMNEEIKATLHATKDEADCVIEELTYSIASYCYSTLSKTKDAKLRTLLVDLLNYGAAAQTYTGYHIDALVNAELTAEQLAWGTAADPDLTSVKNSRYNEINNPSLLWKGVSLSLNDSITMQFVFTTESTEGVTIKVKNENGALLKEFSADEFTTLGGYYIARLKVLTAGQMSDTVYVTAYCGDEAISNTFAYSIESYAYSKQNDSDENLADLVKAMMKYGNAARAYAT